MANVLVVDDAVFVRLTIKQMLEAHGHSMIGEAGNGIDAVKKFKMLKPDVVILDLTMPMMNGIEALKRIKEIDPEAKVIICTALGQQDMLATAVTYGVEEFIVKPFKEEKVIAAVEKLMSK